jgi:ABC transporter with metal-binding/Fe-S-binding domain ATP-binding protein
MKLGVLFSGGKDSTLAMQLASEHHEISCLLSMKSENDASYMFHTPNIGLTELQAEALDIPLITGITKGEKELELSDLKDLIKNAIELFGIEGIVTGAVESVYQAQRVQKICADLGLWCFNPLWQMDQIELLETLIRKKYNIIISAIAAYPLDESWLGRKLDSKMISELKALTGVNPAGEGGEFESLVLNAPMFKREIKIIESEKEYDNHAGVFIVKEADLK